jgi:hypothetical protein
MPRNRWIQDANPKKGALHKQLGYPSRKHIPVPVLQRIKSLPIGRHIQGSVVTELMKQRALFALNARRRKS